jgi:hypothetical protein
MVTANEVGTRKLSYERPSVSVKQAVSVSSTALPAPPYAHRLPAPPQAPGVSRAHPAPPFAHG